MLKFAIEREESQACLSYTEHELIERVKQVQHDVERRTHNILRSVHDIRNMGHANHLGNNIELTHNYIEMLSE